jgi:hypothetical protein
MSKHLIYGAHQFHLKDDENVEALASRLTDPDDRSAWVRFQDHAGDHHLVLRNAPFPIVLSQESRMDPTATIR